MFKFFIEQRNGNSTEYSSVYADKWRCDSSGKYALFNKDGKMIRRLDIGEVVSVESTDG